MARPADRHEATRERILKTACRLFVELGYEETSIGLVMREAGLSKAGLYHYFTSKEDILDMAIDHYISESLARMRAAGAGKSTGERLIVFIAGNREPDEIARNLALIKGRRPNSYAAYRIREKTLHANIPLLEEILEAGMREGIYRRAGDPRRVAEILVLLAKALGESNFLPPAGPEEVGARLELYLGLIRTWLSPPEEELRKIAAAFGSELILPKSE